MQNGSCFEKFSRISSKTKPITTWESPDTYSCITEHQRRTEISKDSDVNVLKSNTCRDGINVKISDQSLVEIIDLTTDMQSSHKENSLDNIIIDKKR